MKLSPINRWAEVKDAIQVHTHGAIIGVGHHEFSH